MTKEELDVLTDWIKENVARNGYFLTMSDGTVTGNINSSEVIFSLHNLLYKEVTGDTYDYWFHWTNKEGVDGLNEHIFEKGGVAKLWQNNGADSY